eukprot:jgi/Psemu1/4936/gm1.4936_g
MEDLEELQPLSRTEEEVNPTNPIPASLSINQNWNPETSIVEIKFINIEDHTSSTGLAEACVDLQTRMELDPSTPTQSPGAGNSPGTQAKKYQVDGVEIKVGTKFGLRNASSIIYTKAHWRGLDDKLLTENHQNLHKYDLLNLYTILIPEDNALDDTLNNPNFGRLKTNAHRKPITYDLFANYLQVTAKQVALSSKYYAEFFPAEQMTRENLTWSFAYYKKNIDKILYSTVHSLWMDYEPSEQGGSLFLKLLLNKVSTTEEANLKALTHTLLATYQIKRDCNGEDIGEVVELLTAILNNLVECWPTRDLPDEAITNLICLFGTTSIEPFNTLFDALEAQRQDVIIYTHLDSNYPAAAKSGGAIVILNDLTSAKKFILHFTHASYNNMWKPGTCFNCGSEDHLLWDCPKPQDPDRIKQCHSQHPKGPKQRCVSHQYRPPRTKGKVIDGAPHTWDKNFLQQRPLDSRCYAI